MPKTDAREGRVWRLIQRVADDLAEAAVGTDEAADRLLAIADALIPLDDIPVVGGALEELSDLLLEHAVDVARQAWLDAQDEERRRERIERRQSDPFRKAADRPMRRAVRLARVSKRLERAGIEVTPKTVPGLVRPVIG